MNGMNELRMLLGPWLAFAQVVAALVIIAATVYAVNYGIFESKRLGKHRKAFFAFLCMWAGFAGAKHMLIQIVDLPAWLTVSVDYVEETPTKATFGFSSPKDIPADTVIDFSVAIGGGSETNWIARPSAVYGLRQHEISTADLTPSHITNYLVRITSDYIPSDTYIHDFTAVASKTNLAVSVDFNCSTNLIGAPGIVQHRDLIVLDDITVGDMPWQTDYSFTTHKDNHITILGNFVSRGTDREFRVVVSNEVLNVWKFSR